MVIKPYSDTPVPGYDFPVIEDKAYFTALYIALVNGYRDLIGFRCSNGGYKACLHGAKVLVWKGQKKSV